jgi:hypothetical protein
MDPVTISKSRTTATREKKKVQAKHGYLLSQRVSQQRQTSHPHDETKSLWRVITFTLLEHMETMCPDPMGDQGRYNQSTEGGTEISVINYNIIQVVASLEIRQGYYNIQGGEYRGRLRSSLALNSVTPT